MYASSSLRMKNTQKQLLVLVEGCVRSRIPNSVSLDKFNTFFISFAFIFVCAILCSKVNVAAVLVRSSAG